MDAILRTPSYLLGRLFGTRAGQRWLFRPNRGWFGGDRLMDFCVAWISVALMVMGGALITQHMLSSPTLLGSPQWPTVEGNIVSIRVTERTSEFGTGWVPELTYHYEVGNRQYRSTQITAARDLHWKSRDAADEFLSRYVARNTVTVYYNPRVPSEALLEPASGGIAPQLTVGLLLSVLGAIFVFIYGRLH